MALKFLFALFKLNICQLLLSRLEKGFKNMAILTEVGPNEEDHQLQPMEHEEGEVGRVNIHF